MSEKLAAAAAALGIPEALLERSAAARAAEIGATVDDVLTEWAGGDAAPVSAPPTEPAGESEPTETETVREPAETAVPEIVIEMPAREEPQSPAAPAGPYEPPVLIGVTDNPMTVLIGTVGLFLIVLLVGLLGPAIPIEIAGARTSEIPYSDAALSGQEIYARSGCAACHTQMVRPVVADVGLGAVTMNDSNQILGTRRFGPDLSDVGSRVTASQIGAIIEGLGDHPALALDAEDINDLVAYLTESQTSSEGS